MTKTIFTSTFFLVLLTTFTGNLLAKTDSEIVEEAAVWIRKESDKLKQRPADFIKIEANSKVKAKDYDTFKKMLKPETTLCSENTLVIFNRKLEVAVKVLPIINLNFFCYESEFPGIGFYNKSLLVVSNKSLELLTDDEFVAALGHELGHTSFTNEVVAAAEKKNFEKLKLIELKCDVIAVALLRKVGFVNGEELLVDALKKIFNSGETFHKDHYISQQERLRFIETVPELLGFTILE